MAAAEQSTPIPIPLEPNTVPNNLRYQSFLDNLHDFQSRGSKSQIRNSEDKIRTSFGFELRPVSGNERVIVNELENSTSPPLPYVVRNPPFEDENGLININTDDNYQLRANKGEKLLKEIAGENLPSNYEFIFMFDACSELTYCFLENENVYAIVTPEVIGDSAASSGNEQGYFKEDIMPQTPNIEHISPRRVIHFNSGIQHGQHLSLRTPLQYSVPNEEIYKSNAMEAYLHREKKSLDISKQFDIRINDEPFENNGNKCSSGTSVSILHKFLGFTPTPQKSIISFKPRFSSLKMFNPFKRLTITSKDDFCLDYKRGGDFNQAHSLKDFIYKLKQLNGQNPKNFTEPIIIKGKVVYVVFASGDYFSAYHAAKYCGLRSIYFNGVRQKRRKGISFSTSPGKKTLSGKIHSWMKNNHSYAIFNCGRNPVIHTNQDVNFDDNMLNLEYIEILSHPFDNIILPTNNNFITNNIDFQTIKDTIETAIKICTEHTINEDEGNASRTGAAAADQGGQIGGTPSDELLGDSANNTDNDVVFENLLKVKSEKNHIIQISKDIYVEIMKLIKFNNNSYSKDPDSDDDHDIFSLSKSHLIIENNEGQWTNINAQSLLDDEELYTQHTLFDILILYLSDHKLTNGSENVWTSQRGPYPFKEIVFEKTRDVPSYFFYQRREGVIPEQVTYGYGRYLNSNIMHPEFTITQAKQFISDISQELQQKRGGRKRSRINNQIFNPSNLKKRIIYESKQPQSSKRSREENINLRQSKKQRQSTVSIKDYFNSFLSGNNIYLSNKLDILLDVVELSQYMHEVNRICSISFDKCDEFIKNPGKDFMEKVKTIKTNFILSQIESVKANSNNLEELIKILEIFNFYFNSENHDNIDFVGIFSSLQQLHPILTSQKLKKGGNIRKKNKIRLTKKKNKKTKAKNKKTKKKNKKTKKN